MKIDKRRRRENKTDYQTRMELLKSGKARVVVRKTNKYIIIQYVKSDEALDKVIIGISSKDLLKHGWDKTTSGSLKSIPACYLTGYYIGKKINEKEKGKHLVFDMGMARNIKAGRIYSALKGLIDAGVKINHSEEIFPSNEKIEGKHLNKNVQKSIETTKLKLK